MPNHLFIYKAIFSVTIFIYLTIYLVLVKHKYVHKYEIILDKVDSLLSYNKDKSLIVENFKLDN